MDGGIIGGCVVPHPPLLIPDIGGKDRESVRSTSAAMDELSRRIAELDPEVLLMISPHTPPYRDSFTIKTAPMLEGSFASFGKPNVRISKQNDIGLVEEIAKKAEVEGVPLIPSRATSTRWSGTGEELDHGLLVPLYYLDQALESPVVCFSISGLPYRDHFRLGEVARDACEERAQGVLRRSGDLSHALKERPQNTASAPRSSPPHRDMPRPVTSIPCTIFRGTRRGREGSAASALSTPSGAP